MRRGIGLIELMIVLAIMAIAAMLVIPSWGTTASVRADAAAHMLLSDIEYAQVHSIANPNDPIGVVLAPDGSGYWLSYQDEPETPIIREDSGDPYRVIFGKGRASFSSGVSASADNVTDGILLFDALGGLTNPTVDPAYRLSCEDAEIHMTVRAGTGFIQIHH